MLIAILLTACITAFAAGRKNISVLPKKVDYQLSISRIVLVLSGDIDLRLVESRKNYLNRGIQFFGKKSELED